MGRGTQTPWTNPDLQRLFKAWHDGEEIGVICAAFWSYGRGYQGAVIRGGGKKNPRKTITTAARCSQQVLERG